MNTPVIIEGRAVPAPVPGRRFRRRPLRRGYKVEEVDAFLDHAQATLDGAPIGPAVRAYDVEHVVFRVRFSGYDEWEVDNHLDRVLRQLHALEGPPCPVYELNPIAEPNLTALSRLSSP